MIAKDIQKVNIFSVMKEYDKWKNNEQQKHINCNHFRFNHVSWFIYYEGDEKMNPDKLRERIREIEFEMKDLDKELIKLYKELEDV